jgi:hypothetical protein
MSILGVYCTNGLEFWQASPSLAIAVIVETRELRDGPENDGVSNGTCLIWTRPRPGRRNGCMWVLAVLGSSCSRSVSWGLEARSLQRKIPSGNSGLGVLGILGHSVFEAQPELHPTKVVHFLLTYVPLRATHHPHLQHCRIAFRLVVERKENARKRQRLCRSSEFFRDLAPSIRWSPGAKGRCNVDGRE